MTDLTLEKLTEDLGKASAEMRQLGQLYHSATDRVDDLIKQRARYVMEKHFPQVRKDWIACSPLAAIPNPEYFVFPTTPPMLNHRACVRHLDMTCGNIAKFMNKHDGTASCWAPLPSFDEDEKKDKESEECMRSPAKRKRGPNWNSTECKMYLINNHAEIKALFKECAGHDLPIMPGLVQMGKLHYSNFVLLIKDANGDVDKFTKKYPGTSDVWCPLSVPESKDTDNYMSKK